MKPTPITVTARMISSANYMRTGTGTRRCGIAIPTIPTCTIDTSMPPPTSRHKLFVYGVGAFRE
jgi:hypothetical protein